MPEPVRRNSRKRESEWRMIQLPRRIIQLPLFALDPKPANGKPTKACSRCGFEQPVSAFSPSSTYRLGVYHLCKGCTKEHDAVVRIFRQDGGYELYFRLQGGRCGIETCTRVPTDRDLCVDVDHWTMKVRGLLCSNCNVMLGQMEKTDAVVKYLLGFHLRGDGNEKGEDQ